MGKNQWVVPYRKQWAHKVEGSQTPVSVHRKQETAIEGARAAAIRERAELFIKNRQGQIRERNTYKKDPFPPRG